ncbi:MAG: hypothetical protein ACRC7N_10815 [Clostridium sp.]
MTYRVIITKDSGKYYVGKTFTEKKYKILKNEYSEGFRIGLDYHFYAKEEKGLLSTTLIPISDEEAGVVMR